MKQKSLLLGVGRSHHETSLLSAFLKLLDSGCSCPVPRTALSTSSKVPVAAWAVPGPPAPLARSGARQCLQNIVPQHPEAARPLRAALLHALAVEPPCVCRGGVGVCVPEGQGPLLPVMSGQRPPEAEAGTTVGKPQQICPSPAKPEGRWSRGPSEKLLPACPRSPPARWRGTWCGLLLLTRGRGLLWAWRISELSWSQTSHPSLQQRIPSSADVDLCQLTV